MRTRRAALLAGGGWLLVLCLAAGCAVHSLAPERVLTSPAHHVANGVKLMQKGRLEAAEREFRIALELDPRCGSAHRGEAVIRGVRRDFDGAFEEIHRAVRFTTPEELADPIQEEFARCRSIRWDRKTWRRPSPDEETANLARSFVVEYLNAYYLMGVAFKLGDGHIKQEEGLGKALSMTNEFSASASERLLMLREVGDLGLKTDLARGLAFIQRVDRAEAAGLLVRELRLAEILAEKETEGGKPSPPPDLAAHPLADDCLLVLGFGIDGFGCADDGSFRPDDPMPRAGFAAALADVLALTGEDRRAKETGTQLSPFVDVPLSSPYLRAVAACAALGILEGDGEGRFRPDEPVSGLDSVRSIHRLKEALESP